MSMARFLESFRSLALALALAPGCAGSLDAGPASPPAPPTVASPAVAPASLLPPTNEVDPGAPAASVLTFADRVARRMNVALTNVYEEGQPPSLNYTVWLRDYSFVSFHFPYDVKVDGDGGVTADLSQYPEAVLFTEYGPPPRHDDWRSTTGQVEVRRQPDGSFRVLLSRVLLDNGFGRTRTEDGEVVGSLQRACVYYVPDYNLVDAVSGEPARQSVPDPEWTSPYCRSQR